MPASPPGGVISFGIDRDIARTGGGGNSADLLARAKITAQILPPLAAKPVTVKGAFTNNIGTGWSPADGFGLINADAALISIGH